MVDVVDVKTRSQMMSGIRAKNTKPELVIRRTLFALGFRFRLHRRDLPGAPDIVLPGRRVVLFVHGCFWHRHKCCRYAKLPTTRPAFWKGKLDGNVSRDKQAVSALLAQGWRVLVVWECAIRNRETLGCLPEMLTKWIGSSALSGEITGGARLQKP